MRRNLISYELNVYIYIHIYGIIFFLYILTHFPRINYFAIRTPKQTRVRDFAKFQGHPNRHNKVDCCESYIESSIRSRSSDVRSSFPFRTRSYWETCILQRSPKCWTSVGFFWIFTFRIIVLDFNISFSIFCADSKWLDDYDTNGLRCVCGGIRGVRWRISQ